SPNGRISSGCRMSLTLTLSPLSRGEGTCPLPRPARGERVRVKGETVLVHSSDIHIDDRRGTEGLEAVLDAARALRADVVLLAGDTFEGNQLGVAVLDRAARLLAEADMSIVILPGNHDPALPDSVFVRGGIASIPNVNVLGVTDQEAVRFPAHDLEVWGHAHRDYFDMAPLR